MTRPDPSLTQPLGTVRLKPGRDKKIRNRYPWIQKGELAQVSEAEDGRLTTVLDSDGQFLAIGTYNGRSRFPVRILTREKESIDTAWFLGRIERAIGTRASLESATNSIRWLFSEADGVAGLIVDVYNGHGVVQVRSKGMEVLRPFWTEALQESGLVSLTERSDMAGRAEEGLPAHNGDIFGDVPDQVEMMEGDRRYLVPLKAGLKTGFYLDQRNSRFSLQYQVAPDHKVLDCFCYSGGFAIAAAKGGPDGGAQAWGVDMNPTAIATARENARLNDLHVPFIEANAFEFLEEGAGGLGPFDWIILDPPAISKTRETRDSLKWAIWKLVYLALPLLRPGGRLVVGNCSYQLTLPNMLDTCRLAAADRGEGLVLEEVTYQDIDHPAPLWFPEALYLKNAWLRKE